MNESCCRQCSSNQLSMCLTLKNAPPSIQRLLTKEQLGSDVAISLSVYQCMECGLFQLTEALESNYYDDYVMTASHSPQMRAFQRSQAFSFVSSFDLLGKRVIEIGCGDGNYLQYLHEAGAIPYGIEPSKPFCQMAKERGFQVLEMYVGLQQPVPGAPYDAFVARQVLEHIPNPNGFLQGIRQALSPTGVGLVEVPSLEQTLEGGRYYDFCSDHLSYFSSLTLRHALERNGFVVLEVTRGMNREYNVAVVSKAPEYEFVTLQRELEVATQDLRTFVETYYLQGKRVAVWGAGGKGITVLAVAQVRDITYVVDSDPHKKGRFTPVSHLPIFTPEKLLSDPVDAVIVTAVAYRDEILTELREALGFQGTIAVLGERLQVV
jgi:SAM-dependent methyltransferase